MMLKNADKLDDQYENLQKKLMKKDKVSFIYIDH